MLSLNSAYYTTFFPKNENSIRLVDKTFEILSQFSRLKRNTSKYEIAGIGVLKGVPVVVCGMNSIDLTTDFIKILCTCFSYNQKIKEKVNILRNISSIQSVPKLRKMRNLTLEGRIVILKTVFQSLIYVIPNHITSELISTQKNFEYLFKKI